MCIISTTIIRYTLIRYVPWLTRRFFYSKNWSHFGYSSLDQIEATILEFCCIYIFFIPLCRYAGELYRITILFNAVGT